MTSKEAFVKNSANQARSAQVGVNLGFDELSNGLVRDSKRYEGVVAASVIAAMPVAGIKIEMSEQTSGYDMGSGVLKYAGINADLSPKDEGVMIEKAGFDREKVKQATRKALSEIVDNGGLVGKDGKMIGGTIGKESVKAPYMDKQVEAMAIFVEKLSEHVDTRDLWNGDFGKNGLGLHPMLDRDGRVQLTVMVTKKGPLQNSVLIPNVRGRYPDGSFDMSVVADPEIGIENAKGAAPYILLRQDVNSQALYLGNPNNLSVTTFIRDTFDKNRAIVKREALNLSLQSPVWQPEKLVNADVESERVVKFDLGWGKAEYVMTEGMPYKGLVANPETEDSMHLYFEEAHYWIYKKTVNPNISKADFLTMLQQGKVEYPVKVTGDTFSGGLVEKRFNPANGVVIEFKSNKDGMYYSFGASEAVNFAIDSVTGKLTVSIFDSSRINSKMDPGEQEVYMSGLDRQAWKILAFNKDTKNASNKAQWVRELGEATRDMDEAMTNTLISFPGERWTTIYNGEKFTSVLPTIFRVIR